MKNTEIFKDTTDTDKLINMIEIRVKCENTQQ